MSEFKPKFEVHASLILQLGESLITDDVSALLELVKNSYDADASYSSITIETARELKENSFFTSALGFLIVQDDGVGMDIKEIERGWLTVSYSEKKELKAKGLLTKGNRTPLGDKGLGRLGAQRLGRYLELFTTKKGSNTQFHVGIDWHEFLSREKLSEVSISYKEISPSPYPGTKIIISGLSNPKSFQTEITELQKKLSQLIFPFSDVRPFDIFANINSIKLELGDFSQKILDIPSANYSFSFDGTVLKIYSRYKLTFFKPTRAERDEIAVYNKLIATDLGLDFFNYLKAKNNIIKSEKESLYIEFNQEKEIDSIGEIEYIDEIFCSPGPFDGKIYSFDLGEFEDSMTGVFDNLSAFRQFVKNNAGIRIFRDGFGIRPYGLEGNDWLKLGQSWTGGGSYYGLKPQNAIGYVNITAKENACLEEITNREGFKDSPFYRNFYRLTQAIVKTINDNNEILRRGFNSYKKKKAEEDVGLDAGQDVKSLYSNIRGISTGASKLQAPVETAILNVDVAKNEIDQLSKQISSIADQNIRNNTSQVVANVRKTLEDTKSLIIPVSGHLEKSGKVKDSISVLETDLLETRKQLRYMAELGALGLTAEALSHEISRIASNIARRTANISVILKNKTENNLPDLLIYIEHVKSAVSALRKQLAHLSPSLRYIRDQVDTIYLKSFISDIQYFYQERLSRNQIELVFTPSSQDFMVEMSKGKLTQVLDNLIVNSEYWLKEEIRKKKLSHGKIFIELCPTIIRISDNGRGIDSSIENRLFEPFVTNKPQGKGRGLGLFIVQQLLDSSGCSISLNTKRNEYGNMYIFEIDLGGVVSNGE